MSGTAGGSEVSFMTNHSTPARIVADLMTDDLITVGTEDTIDNARDLVLSLGIHALPVVENDAVVGILTTSDLSDDWPADELIGSAMSAPVCRISPDASIREAADEMLAHSVHHLIVENKKGAIGLLSSFDLLRAISTSWPG